jgi:putative DNA primase/helicase
MPRNLAEAMADDPAPFFRPIDVHDFVRREFPPRENLLAPWMPAKGLAMVYAPRGVGKTHFALGVAYAIASAGAFLKWQADKPRKVLLLDGEMPPAVLQERLLGIIANNDREPAPGSLMMLPFDMWEDGSPDLGTEEGQRALEPFFAEAELIIVDNISTLCRSGKENEAEGWAVIQAWALSQRRKGRSVLFIHHAGKGGDQRGTSKREDVLDTVIRLSHPEDYEPTDGARFLVTFTKSRGIFGSDVEPFEAKMQDGKWTCFDTTDLLEAEVAALLAEGKSLRDIAGELGISKSKVDRIKKRLAP